MYSARFFTPSLYQSKPCISAVIWYNSAGSAFLCMRLKQGRQMKTLGSIRRSDCVEAELVLASGVYLTFRLAAGKSSLNSLIEVKRTRRYMRPRESIRVDAHMLQKARRAALDAILAHRQAMHMHAPLKQRARAQQLPLKFS